MTEKNETNEGSEEKVETPLTTPNIHDKIDAFARKFMNDGVKTWGIRADVKDTIIELNKAFFPNGSNTVFVIECFDDEKTPFLIYDVPRNLYRMKVGVYTFDDLYQFVTELLNERNFKF